MTSRLPPNILARDFKAAQPNEKWVTDVTEFNVGGQKLYLSPIMDLYNGEIVAYETAKRPLLNMVKKMLTSAFKRPSWPIGTTTSIDTAPSAS